MRAPATALLAAAVAVLHASAINTGERQNGVFGAAQDAIAALDALKAPPPAAGADMGSDMRFSSRADASVEESAEPTGECAICEDVIQTWRESFPCAGMAEPDYTPDSSVVRPRSSPIPHVAAPHPVARCLVRSRRI